MRGRRSSDDLQYDPEIERTARANRKAARLSKSVPPSAREQIPVFTEAETNSSPKTSLMGDHIVPLRSMLGDYGLANNRGRLTHTFQLNIWKDEQTLSSMCNIDDKVVDLVSRTLISYDRHHHFTNT